MNLNRKFITAIYIFLICSLSSNSLAVTDTKFIEVEVQFDGTYALVPVSIGERNLMFILDSAAGGSVISPDTRNALGFTENDGEIATIVGAGGEVNYQSLKIPKISVGGFTRNNFNVTVIDLKKFQKKEGGEPYAGILGNDFLRNFDVELNLPGSKLYLYPHDDKGQTEVSKLKKLPGISNQGMAEGFIGFNVFVEGKPVNAILDTGAPATIMNWHASKQANITQETEGVRRREQATGGLGTQRAETFLYNFKNIKAGNTRFFTDEIRIADLPIFRALGLSEKPAMIFGLDMLKKQVLFVSYSTKKIYFYKATSTQKQSSRTNSGKRIVKD
jgi:predicted aspartyl protease